MSIVHATPGLLDIRAITIHGLSAKPSSDKPIGKFGTGLKYAIATLLRHGCRVQLFIGATEFEFFVKPGDFRGIEYQQIYMKKRNGILSKWQSVELPFTLQYGKYWEPWQAFRELHSNTLDEGGQTGVYDNYPCARDETVFIITGDAYAQAYYDKDKTFLPNALTRRESSATLEVINQPSEHLYWRGIRVHDLPKPSIYTYNILKDMELTEDRTLKYMFEAQQVIATFVGTSKDQKFINAVVSADGEKHFEGRIDFDYNYQSPSPEYLGVVQKKKLRGGYVSPRALTYYDKYAPKPVVEDVSIEAKISKWAYDTDIPEELQKLLKYLLHCDITEPAPSTLKDDEIPF